MTRVALVWLTLVGACVERLDTSRAPCPCDAEHECCPTLARDQCVPRGKLLQCVLPANCPLPGGTPTLEIAEYLPLTNTIRPLAADGRIPLYVGPQGGFHIYVQVLMSGFDYQNVRVRRRILDLDGNEHQFQEATVPFVCDSTGAWIAPFGQQTFVCPSTQGERLHDRDLLLEVTLVERTGSTIVRRFPIHPFCADGDTYCVSSPQGCAAAQGP